MGFADFIKTLKRDSERSMKDNSSHWVKCDGCSALMYQKEVANQLHVCPKCNFHFKISLDERIKLLCDEESFVEFDTDLIPVDPLKFVDKESYVQKIKRYKERTKRESAVVSGFARINKAPVELIIFDFQFMGGSLGSVEGEKIVRAINRAISKRHALLIISASGGARMQESVFSLMQMAKTSAALQKLSNAHLPFISLLTNPTFGGVSASFAFLGDLIISEPGAMIGFAGARVIKQTIGADLPDGFQTAEFLLNHGLIDMVVNRKDLKKTISDLINLLGNHENKSILYS
ncbi:MAG: acetyl-CoA carboxylase, carboxyltransferase subunit beta [Helicobacter sp.]|nr:acetyl-CoA carboxylase, carboxyltransferase subunit beta [Helicobacter sp.]